jgi:pSer/pThr/pTyr-binding forkhead associated (FHA) protein
MPICGVLVMIDTPVSTPFTFLTLVSLAICVILVSIAILVVAIRLLGRHRMEKERDKAWAEVQAVVHESGSGPDNERTQDNWMPGPNAFGKLTVQTSDDRTLIGHHFELNEEFTTLGRGKDNDIKFPKDGPVSRHHARIEKRDDGVYLSEVMSTDASGQVTRPKFGTFVNQTRVDSGSVILKSGDLIQLGKRVHLKFEPLTTELLSNDQTYVAFSSQNANLEKTREQPGSQNAGQTIVSPVTKDTDP